MDKGGVPRIHDRRVMGIAAAGVLAIFGLLTLFAGPSRARHLRAGRPIFRLPSPTRPTRYRRRPLTYSIQVANAGPDAAIQVVVTDNLPNGVTLVSANSSQGSCPVSARKTAVTCRLGTIGVEVGPSYTPPPLHPRCRHDHD